MGKQIQKFGIGKFLIWGGILLSIATYLVIVIPGLYNKSAAHPPIDGERYFNVGMWRLNDGFGGPPVTTQISTVGIIGIILFVLAFISTMCGIILRKGGKVVSKKLTITSLVTLFVTALVFIMIIISKPNNNTNASSVSTLIWGSQSDLDYIKYWSFSNYGWTVLAIAIVAGVCMVGSFIPLCFKKHNSSAK